ncbi:MAG: dihydrodipicolinate synthase family protein, partial [Anaerolineae bacterium]|nr:dihydrodipicolinate synthase family protein [Anaerolineae bacterium]
MSELFGIVPPVATPFDAQEEIDLALLQAEVRHLIERVGVHGVAAGGSTGEGQTLTRDELRTIVGATVEAASGRVPVVAGIIVDSTREAIA